MPTAVYSRCSVVLVCQLQFRAGLPSSTCIKLLYTRHVRVGTAAALSSLLPCGFAIRLAVLCQATALRGSHNEMGTNQGGLPAS